MVMATETMMSDSEDNVKEFSPRKRVDSQQELMEDVGQFLDSAEALKNRIAEAKLGPEGAARMRKARAVVHEVPAFKSLDEAIDRFYAAAEKVDKKHGLETGRLAMNAGVHRYCIGFANEVIHNLVELLRFAVRVEIAQTADMFQRPLDDKLGREIVERLQIFIPRTVLSAILQSYAGSLYGNDLPIETPVLDFIQLYTEELHKQAEQMEVAIVEQERMGESTPDGSQEESQGASAETPGEETAEGGPSQQEIN